MAADPRAFELAQVAVDLAAGSGVAPPAGLALWARAGGRPAATAGAAAPPTGDPATALVAALESALTGDERRRGAHYTPAELADRVAELALDGCAGAPSVVDPACGGGALLLAAARRLAARGIPPEHIARDLLWGADLDPLAAAVTEAAIALWSGGTAPRPGHVVSGDTLLDGSGPWPRPPFDGFDVVIGNPPFQGQLARATSRSSADTARLRARFGAAVSPYVDTAALFMLAGVELAHRGGRVALVQPQSTVASRDAGPVRAALAERARLVELWAAKGHPFAAKVHVCVPVLEVGCRPPSTPVDADRAWTERLASARGVPELDITSAGGCLAERASTTAGFRNEYYGLVDHVRESAGPASDAPLLTSGAIGVGVSAWGQRPVRFAKRRWQRPEVDLGSLAADDPGLRHWVERLRRPKVVVASQTRVVEAVADRAGTAVPVTPVVSVLPHDPDDVGRLTAALCSPPVAVWAARAAAGTGLSAEAIRMSARLLLTVPLPVDRERWDAATAALGRHDLEAYGGLASDMYGLPPEQADAALAWWSARRPGRT